MVGKTYGFARRGVWVMVIADLWVMVCNLLQPSWWTDRLWDIGVMGYKGYGLRGVDCTMITFSRSCTPDALQKRWKVK